MVLRKKGREVKFKQPRGEDGNNSSFSNRYRVPISLGGGGNKRSMGKDVRPSKRRGGGGGGTAISACR